MIVFGSGFDEEKPTALVLGRFQPFHEGHRQIVLAGLKKAGQVLIAVRTMPRSSSNPYSFSEVLRAIQDQELEGNVGVILVPNITTVLFGRTPGWVMQRVELPESIERISGTEIRAALDR